MKKQDILTPIGLILGIGFVLFGISNGDVELKAFYDTASIAITVGGSFAAVLITFSIEEIKLLIKMTSKLFTINSTTKPDLIFQLKELSKKSKREGFLSIEEDVSEIENDFLRSGLELVIDRVETETIVHILEISILEVEGRYNKGGKIYKTWGSYAPAFGMIGTLIGLIQMLADLESPDVIASGMAKALITTLYGALLANIVLNPLGYNLQNKGQREVEYREMMLVGILSIKNGEGTRIMEEKLMNFLSKDERKKYLKESLYQNERVAINDL